MFFKTNNFFFRQISQFSAKERSVEIFDIIKMNPSKNNARYRHIPYGTFCGQMSCDWRNSLLRLVFTNEFEFADKMNAHVFLHEILVASISELLSNLPYGFRVGRTRIIIDIDDLDYDELKSYLDKNAEGGCQVIFKNFEDYEEWLKRQSI